MDDFTKKFNQVLDASGLNGVQISELLHIHPPTLVKYKNGKSLMSMQTLYHFCKTFNVSADWLMGLNDNPNPGYERQTIQGEVIKAVSSERPAQKSQVRIVEKVEK